MITVRRPEDIYQAGGEIQDGSFRGRWHFSFGGHTERDYSHFGTLRVFNDDTLSPGSTWPLHPHRDIEVVTYCAGGEFRHADENGKGSVLRKGWVQHTTVGDGMWHSEINNLPDKEMRFIQMWFYPSKTGLKPHYEQKAVDKPDRTNTLLPLVSPVDRGALHIFSDARIFSSFLEKSREVSHALGMGRGAYIYVLEGGPVSVNGQEVQDLGAAAVEDEAAVTIKALEDSELLMADVLLIKPVVHP